MSKANVPTGDIDLGLLELGKSNLIAKIPDSLRTQYVRQSLAFGNRLSNELKGEDIERLYVKSGIKLTMVSNHGSRTGVVLRGQIDLRNNVVSIYQESIDSLADICNPLIDSQLRLSHKQFLDMHLAHEYFHFLEHERGTHIEEQLPAVTISSFFGHVRTAKVLQCSEIAAQSFSKTFCGLAVLPTFYDFVYLNAQRSAL